MRHVSTCKRGFVQVGMGEALPGLRLASKASGKLEAIQPQRTMLHPDTGQQRLLFPASRMRVPTMKIAGFILLVLGVLAVIYQGISYTHEKQFLKVGPIQAQKKETSTIPISPIFGVIAIVGGGLLIYGAERQR